jgi:endonuclease/exonuclease/phosphatase family metal-dependent hydrolase
VRVDEVVDEVVYRLNEPLWKGTEWIAHSNPLVKVAGVFTAVIGLPASLIGRSLHWSSQLYFQKPYSSYTCLSGQKQTTESGEPRKFLTLNACMFPGALPTFFGGMTPASNRIDAVCKLIKDQKPDVVCLQEVSVGPARQLMENLKDQYAYFYYNIGPHPFGMESALFWASKTQPAEDPVFVPFNIPHMQRGFRRGFFVVKFADRHVITTHLDPHSGPIKAEVRTQQIKAILAHTNSFKKPFVLLGDLNIDSTDIEAQKLLNENFKNFQDAAVKKPNEGNATCWDNCPDSPAQWATVDHILLSDQKTEQKRVAAFVTNKLEKAISDHHAVVLELSHSKQGEPI